MVGDYDGLTGRELVQPLNPESHAGEREKHAGQRSSYGTAALYTGNDQDQYQCDQPEHQEQADCIDSIDQPERRAEERGRRLG